MTHATATVLACIGPFEVEKTAGVAGYALFRNDPDVGRAFVGHYRDIRDCERVAKRTLANEAETDFVQTVLKVADVMADNGTIHFADAHG